MLSECTDTSGSSAVGDAPPRNARPWRMALGLLLACCLFGCRMSHIESARQALSPEEQPVDGEPSEPQDPEPGDETGNPARP